MEEEMKISRSIPASVLIAVAMLTASQCFPLATGCLAAAQTDTNANTDTNTTQDQTQCKADTDVKAPELAWTVLPPRVIRDNYGHNVSNKYIAIDVIVHNSYACNQLVVKGFRFVVKGTTDYATTDPTLVKGSIVKGQLVGTRNTVVQVVKTLGLIATGASGFFKSTGASATYNRGVTIFSNPFEKGIELIFPDTTVTYLSNWDKDEVFKSGFVVQAGKEVQGRLFMPIEVVCSENYSPEKPNDNSSNLTARSKECRPPRWGERYPTYDADTVKKNLGEMKVFGQEIAGIRSIH
jgi:hypothetical protein